MDPHQDPWLSDAERTAREIARQDQHMVERLAERGARTLRDRWVLDQTGLDRDLVVELPPSDAYSLPVHARKILPADALARLEGLLAEVRLQNEGLGGCSWPTTTPRTTCARGSGAGRTRTCVPAWPS